jgi:glycosyltransferase involved in cell wall biosynthesis
MARSLSTSVPETAPRKILLVHSSDDLYGADLILLELVRRLDKRRFVPTVVLPTDVFGDGALTRSLRDSGIRTIGLKLGVLRRQFYSPFGVPLFLTRLAVSGWTLARLIRRESIDLVHSHTSAVLPGAFAAWVTGRPHVWQSLEIIVKPRVVWRAMAWLMPRLSERVVGASHATHEHLCLGDGRNREKATVFHYGLDPDRVGAGRGLGAEIRKRWNVSADEPVVGVVARISEWKGQDYFLRVAALVAKTHPRTRFVVVGGTFDGGDHLPEQLKQLAASLGIVDSVRFDGFRTDIPAVLDALDVFVMPSTLPDPFPTAVLEAMAAGKPVVANAHGGSVEMVVDGATGFLVPSDQPEAMAEAVRRLLDDPAARVRFGERAQERLLSHFTVDSYVRNWMDLYTAVLARRA